MRHINLNCRTRVFCSNISTSIPKTEQIFYLVSLDDCSFEGPAVWLLLSVRRTCFSSSESTEDLWFNVNGHDMNALESSFLIFCCWLLSLGKGMFSESSSKLFLCD